MKRFVSVRCFFVGFVSFSFFLFFWVFFWGEGCVFVSVGLLCLSVLPEYDIRLIPIGRTTTQLFSAAA